MKNDLIKGTKKELPCQQKEHEKSRNDYTWLECITSAITKIIQAFRVRRTIEYRREELKDGTTRTEFTYKTDK